MSRKLENVLKSWFLSSLVTYSIIVTVVGAFFLVTESGPFPIWVAVTISAAQIVVYFARLYLVSVPRTSPGLAGFSIGIFVATLYSVYTSYQLQIASAAPLLAFISLCGWLAYVAWYSELGDRSGAKIKEGKKLPQINLEDYDGNKLSSQDWEGQKRLVIFYRGNWCPICTAQVKELADFESDFIELGIRITLISPQSHQKSKNHAKLVGMNYDFLLDIDNSAAKKLGILQESGTPKGFEVLGYQTDVPMPTTFVVNEVGKVVFADLTTNYRLRTKPQDILAALKK